MVTLQNFKKVSIQLKPKQTGWGEAVFGGVAHHPNSWFTPTQEYHKSQLNYEFRVCSLDNPSRYLFTIISDLSLSDLLCKISMSFDCIAKITFRDNEGSETQEETDLLELRETFVEHGNDAYSMLN